MHSKNKHTHCIFIFILIRIEQPYTLIIWVVDILNSPYFSKNSITKEPTYKKSQIYLLGDYTSTDYFCPTASGIQRWEHRFKHTDRLLKSQQFLSHLHEPSLHTQVPQRQETSSVFEQIFLPLLNFCNYCSLNISEKRVLPLCIPWCTSSVIDQYKPLNILTILYQLIEFLKKARHFLWKIFWLIWDCFTARCFSIYIINYIKD